MGSVRDGDRWGSALTYQAPTSRADVAEAIRTEAALTSEQQEQWGVSKT